MMKLWFQKRHFLIEEISVVGEVGGDLVAPIASVQWTKRLLLFQTLKPP
jgi:hypothetical protein